MSTKPACYHCGQTPDCIAAGCTQCRRNGLCLLRCSGTVSANGTRVRCQTVGCDRSECMVRCEACQAPLCGPCFDADGTICSWCGDNLCEDHWRMCKKCDACFCESHLADYTDENGCPVCKKEPK